MDAMKEKMYALELGLIEKADIQSEDKLDLALLFLKAEKQGAFVSKAKSTEDTLHTLTNLLDQLGLFYTTDTGATDPESIFFNVYIAKDAATLQAFYSAKDDTQRFGLLLGYPHTAVETYNTPDAYPWGAEMSEEDFLKYNADGAMRFLTFLPSRTHFLEQLSVARQNMQLIKENAPGIYEERVAIGRNTHTLKS